MSKDLSGAEHVSEAHSRILEAVPAVAAPTHPFSLISEEILHRLPPGVEDAYPLTMLQAGMLFHSYHHSSSTIYLNVHTLHVEAPLKEDLLRESLERVFSRHPALRTTFDLSTYSEMIQLVHKRATPTLVIQDIRHLAPTEQEQAIETWLDSERHAKHPLDRLPLLRCHVHRRSEHRFQFSWSEHHALLDGWSEALVIIEVFNSYLAALGGRLNPLVPPPDYSFRDYVALERETVGSGPCQRFWVKELAEHAAVYIPRWRVPAIQGRVPKVAKEGRRVDPERVSELKGFAQRTTTPVKSVLLSVYLKTLSAFTDEHTVRTGLVVSTRPEVKASYRVCGLFLNTIPFSLDVRGGWDDLARRTHEKERACVPFQRFPFAELQSYAGSQPVLDTAFNFNQFHLYQELRDSESFRVLDYHYTADTHFALLLSVTHDPHTSSLNLEFCYDASEFGADQVRAIADHYQWTLNRMVSEPTACKGADQEQLQILSKSAGEVIALPHYRTVPRLFEVQVKRNPDAVAIAFESQQLTYRELNALANQLARFLSKQGVGPGVLVGLCMERSLEMVVSLLAILKVGGAYVPLDPSYPRARLAYIVDNTQLPVLLTHRRVQQTLPDVEARVLCLHPDWSVISDESDEDLAGTATALDLAYVIFTSGSTGRPKGVQIPHGALVNLLESMREILGFTHRDAILAVTTLSFDIAALEIFLPLTLGAKVQLVDRDVASDGTRLIEALNDPSITFLQATPVTWRLLLEAGWQGKAELTMLCGGEALPREMANRLLGRGAALWNLYGPTETTIWSSAAKVEPGEGPVSLGRPIANTQMYILDNNLRLASNGAPGELHIGGAGLARGYINHPELTAERFIPNPFQGHSGGRLYKTGDLARYRPDGSIEFLGRLDQQVKIRGFRVEVGEIEAVMRRHAGVQDCVITSHEDRPSEQRLVAYVVPVDRQPSGGVSDGTEQNTAEQLSIWRQVWETNYDGCENAVDPTFNIVGWNSSYNGQPIPRVEMLEWVERTIERLLPLCGEKVLEIGCGTGLLLWRIAPRCAAYFGTDFSVKALEGVRKLLGTHGHSYPQVTLLEREADDFCGFEDGHFDTIILNSVVQYFPSAAYFMRVIEGAVRVTRQGGTIFVGDVRNLPLLEAFHASVQLERAPASLPVAEWQRNVRQAVSQDAELAIDPKFFTALMRHLPRISGVRFELKRGSYANELTRFRYDVTIDVERDVPTTTNFTTLDWEKAGYTLETLRELLMRDHPRSLKVQGVKNARLVKVFQAQDYLSVEQEGRTVGDLRARMRESRSLDCIDPESFWKLAKEESYNVMVGGLACGARSGFDVILTRSDRAVPQYTRSDPQESIDPIGTVVREPYEAIALTRRLTGLKSDELRRFLRKELPEYMIPATFVSLATLPLTPNGKVDRSALPPPDAQRPHLESPLVMPKTEAEQVIATAWKQALRLAEVGTRDNLFDLGGNSLHVIQIQSRLEKAFGRSLSAVDMFRYPTVEALAEYLSHMPGEESTTEPSDERAQTRSARQSSMAQIRKSRRIRRSSGGQGVDSHE